VERLACLSYRAIAIDAVKVTDVGDINLDQSTTANILGSKYPCQMPGNANHAPGGFQAK